VKFGDTLSLAACTRLIQQLSACKAPFQCAHGRPSVAPVASMSQLDAKEKDNYEKVNLVDFQSLAAMDEL